MKTQLLYQHHNKVSFLILGQGHGLGGGGWLHSLSQHLQRHLITVRSFIIPAIIIFNFLCSAIIYIMTTVYFGGTPSQGKKLKAEFYRDGKRFKSISFGASGMDDYTLTKDKKQRERYRGRHAKDLKKGENPKGLGAGALSYYVLWGDSTSRKANMRSYAKRFGMKLKSSPPTNKI